MVIQDLCSILPRKYIHLFNGVDEYMNLLREIRFRAEQPIMLKISNSYYFLCNDGKVKKEPSNAVVTDVSDIEEILNFVCHDSIYAYQEELLRGYITIKGGHRVGVTGQTVKNEDKITALCNFNSINFRISHEIQGVADEILRYIYEGNQIVNTCIASPPGCGKTTMLRDAIRQISDGNRYAYGKNVCVIDERSEIGGCYRGKAQNNLGVRTDIMDACPKAYGMKMVLRAMAPDLIAVDEIGGVNDLNALSEVSGCGCGILASIHGNSMQELLRKEIIGDFFQNGIFKTVIFLSDRVKIGMIESVWKFDNGKWRMLS